MSTTSFYEVYGQLPTLPKETIDKLLELAEGGGGGGGVLAVHMDENRTLDKTWNEIDAADVAVIVLRRSGNGATGHFRELVTATTIDSDGKYYVEAGDNHTFQTNTADGYPTLGSST